VPSIPNKAHAPTKLSSTSTEIRTPKRGTSTKSKKEVFPYYAGYSEEFVQDILANCSLKESIILDPWNGSGTTTAVAQSMGFNSIGIDLNPVMIAVAKARAATVDDIYLSRKELIKILDTVSTLDPPPKNDPLLEFIGETATLVTRTVTSYALNPKGIYQPEHIEDISNAISKSRPWQAILLLACFRVTKKHTFIKRSSNPTWTKPEKNQINNTAEYTTQNWQAFLLLELDNLEALAAANTPTTSTPSKTPEFYCASSEMIPLDDESIDIILTSPPYCTRIDYAKSTLIELAALGLSSKEVDCTLRKKLMGTTAINNDILNNDEKLNNDCTELLRRIQLHPSTGSKSYYFKNIKQYFLSLQKSIREISRILKKDGHAYVVLQGSHYKEIEIDLARIFATIAESHSLIQLNKISFYSTNHFARINTKSRKYKAYSPTEETLIILKKI
jgi:DNA modification methylase